MTIRHISFSNHLIPCVLVLAALVTPSCSDDDDQGIIPGVAMQDFVTIESRSDRGTIFTFRSNEDSPLITLTAPQIIPDGDGTRTGDRIVIAYQPENLLPYTSGAIEVFGFIRCYNAKVEPSSTITTASGPVPEVIQIWRSGKYLNIVAEVLASRKPEMIKPVIDPATLDLEYPRVSLTSSAVEGPDPHRITVYGSYDISAACAPANVKGLEISYETPSGPATTIISSPQI